MCSDSVLRFPLPATVAVWLNGYANGLLMLKLADFQLFSQAQQSEMLSIRCCDRYNWLICSPECPCKLLRTDVCPEL